MLLYQLPVGKHGNECPHLLERQILFVELRKVSSDQRVVECGLSLRVLNTERDKRIIDVEQRLNLVIRFLETLAGIGTEDVIVMWMDEVALTIKRFQLVSLLLLTLPLLHPAITIMPSLIAFVPQLEKLGKECGKDLGCPAIDTGKIIPFA